jgi:hypothetical protein
VLRLRLLLVIDFVLFIDAFLSFGVADAVQLCMRRNILLEIAA